MKTLSLFLTLFSTVTFGQINTSYFKDTTIRMGAAILGSEEHNNHLYFWGSGIGYEKSMPVIYKIDTAGNEIWNTCRDSVMAFRGFFTTIYIDNDFVYGFGRGGVGEGTFFIAKFNKQDGRLIYCKRNILINTLGIIQCKEAGEELSIVYYTYDGDLSDYNVTPINVVNLRKENGDISAVQPFGISNLPPLLIDNDNYVFYNTEKDSLIKYNPSTATVEWKNRESPAGSYSTRPARFVGRSGNIIYVVGEKWARAVSYSSGETLWNIRLAGANPNEFQPHSIHVKEDTLYISWGGFVLDREPYTYNHFAKLDIKTGEVYFEEMFRDDDVNDPDAPVSFSDVMMAVDSRGDIYLNRYNENSGVTNIKKLSGNGKKLFETVVPADYASNKNDNYVQNFSNDQHRKIYLFNDKPYYLFSQKVTNKEGKSTSHISYLRFSENDGTTKEKKDFDNTFYQYQSTIIDIQTSGKITYILKQQSFDIFLEQYNSERKLIWRSQVPHDVRTLAQNLAVDSAGNVCIASGQRFTFLGDTPYSYSPDSHYLLSRFTIFSAGGQLLKDFQSSGFLTGEQAELIGVENGFYLFTPNQYYIIDTSGYKPTAYSGANFTNAIHHNGWNRNFHLVNTPDSLFVFSGLLTSRDPAFLLAISKSTNKSKTTSLANLFRYGYILYAVKSNRNADHVYLCGVNDVGANPVLAKYDLSARKLVWSYRSNNIGDVFKVVQDKSGDVYAYIKTQDSISVTKFSGNNGSSVWTYGRSADYLVRCTDIDVNTNTGILVAAYLTRRPGSHDISSYMELSMNDGHFLREHAVVGDLGASCVTAVESTAGRTVFIGGHTADQSLGGLSGFLLMNENADTPYKCTLAADFNITNGPDGTPGFRFTNLSTPAGTYTSYWDFGNGDTSIQNNPSYSYNSVGTYDVTLKVINEHQCIDSVRRTITVYPEDVCNITASFSSRPDADHQGKIHFLNTSVASPATYIWDFGNGLSDTTSSPTHQFLKTDTYKVCLKVSTNANCSRDTCQNISVAVNSDVLKIFPNPVPDQFQLYLYSDVSADINVRIMGASGLLVKEMEYYVTQGANYILISVSDLAPGIYFLSAESDGRKHRTTFLKM